MWFLVSRGDLSGDTVSVSQKTLYYAAGVPMHGQLTLCQELPYNAGRWRGARSRIIALETGILLSFASVSTGSWLHWWKMSASGRLLARVAWSGMWAELTGSDVGWSRKCGSCNDRSTGNWALPSHYIGARSGAKSGRTGQELY